MIVLKENVQYGGEERRKTVVARKFGLLEMILERSSVNCPVVLPWEF